MNEQTGRAIIMGVALLVAHAIGLAFLYGLGVILKPLLAAFIDAHFELSAVIFFSSIAAFFGCLIYGAFKGRRSSPKRILAFLNEVRSVRDHQRAG